MQPVGQDEDHFQLAEAVESAPVQYGLTTMGRSKPEVGADGDTVPESRQANGGAGGGWFPACTFCKGLTIWHGISATMPCSCFFQASAPGFQESGILLIGEMVDEGRSPELCPIPGSTGIL